MSEFIENLLSLKTSEIVLFTVPWGKDVDAVVARFNSPRDFPAPQNVKKTWVCAFTNGRRAVEEGVYDFPTVVFKRGDRVVKIFLTCEARWSEAGRALTGGSFIDAML